MNQVKKTELFTGGSTVRVLSFEIKMDNGESIMMAMNIQKIKEILDPTESLIDGLTSNYHPLIGLINLRHLSIPLIDITYFMGGTLDRANHFKDKGKRIIVCEFQRIHLGVMVDQIHKIREFPNSCIQPVPEVLSTFPGNIFNGVLEDNGKFIKLLDIEYVLTKLNVNIAPDSESQRPTEYSLKGKSILVVEDSKLFQKKLLNYFQGKGARVILAENGKEGLQRLAELDKKIDIVFTDIEMPILNGIGMVRKIKENENWKNIPIVFNTSISNPGLVEDIKSEALGHYLVKFDESEIDRVLKTILF